MAIYAGVGGFSLEVPCYVDLSQMTALRAIIKRADGSRVNKDFDAGVIATLVAGSVLMVPVDATDFPKKDHYRLQVGAKDGAGAEILFNVIEFKVEALLFPDFWAV